MKLPNKTCKPHRDFNIYSFHFLVALSRKVNRRWVRRCYKPAMVMDSLTVIQVVQATNFYWVIRLSLPTLPQRIGK